jgi:hypothetical protein
VAVDEVLAGDRKRLSQLLLPLWLCPQLEEWPARVSHVANALAAAVAVVAAAHPLLRQLRLSSMHKWQHSSELWSVLLFRTTTSVALIALECRVAGLKLAAAPTLLLLAWMPTLTFIALRRLLQ